jgi:cold shock CspA family protein
VSQATVKWFSDAKRFGFTPPNYDRGGTVHRLP